MYYWWRVASKREREGIREIDRLIWLTLTFNLAYSIFLRFERRISSFIHIDSFIKTRKEKSMAESSFCEELRVSALLCRAICNPIEKFSCCYFECSLMGSHPLVSKLAGNRGPAAKDLISSSREADLFELKQAIQNWIKSVKVYQENSTRIVFYLS